VLYPRWSNPGTAKSMCGESQPALCGGQRLFFMTTAVHAEFTAVGFCTRRHFPQPPPPSLSTPQQSQSGPRASESASEAAPTIQSFSPYLAPPCFAGSIGAYWGAALYSRGLQGWSVGASQLSPLQSQKWVLLRVPIHPPLPVPPPVLPPPVLPPPVLPPPVLPPPWG